MISTHAPKKPVISGKHTSTGVLEYQKSSKDPERQNLMRRLVQRKTLLLAGQVICAVSAGAFSLVIFLNTPTAFLCVCLALRVVNGVGSAAVDTASFAIISR